jgi:hypothetical protein
MSIEEKTPESKSESSSPPRALKKKWDKSWWMNTAYVLSFALLPTEFLVFFLRGERTADPLLITFSAIGTFALPTFYTILSALLASRRGGDKAYNLNTALFVVNAFLLITMQFASLYWTIGTTLNFSVELSRWDAIYFTLGVLTTAGAGTISPTSDLARAFVSGQMVLDLVFIAGAVTLAIASWSESRS